MNNWVKFVIGLTIGAIVVGGVLIPTMDDINEDISKTYKNNTNTKCNMLAADEELVIEATAAEIKVNGNLVNFGPTYTYVTSDSFGLRQSSSGVNMFTTNPYAGYILTNNAVTIVCKDGQAIATFENGDKLELGYEWLFYAVPYNVPSDYVLTNGNGQYFVKESTPIYMSSSDASAVISGTAINPIVVCNGETVTAQANASVHTDAYNETIYSWDSVTFTYDGREYAFDRVILPSTVVTYTDATAAQYGAMFAVIPLLGIIALVVFAAQGIRNKY